jgi:GPH family glycoside/pentoside/hexuronide:cation symporter
MPYQSLLMEMTPDYNERTRVAAVRGVMQSITGFVVGCSWWLALRPVFADPVTGDPSTVNGMRYISLGASVLILLLGVLPALFVKERYYGSDVVQDQKKIGLIKGLRETLSCKPFLVLCLFTIFFLLGTSIYDSYGRYVGTYYVLEGDWNKSALFQIYGTALYMLASLIFIPIFRRLSERIGKASCLFIAAMIVLFSALTTWFTNTPELPYLMLANTLFYRSRVCRAVADDSVHECRCGGCRRAGNRGAAGGQFCSHLFMGSQAEFLCRVHGVGAAA